MIDWCGRTVFDHSLTTVFISLFLLDIHEISEVDMCACLEDIEAGANQMAPTEWIAAFVFHSLVSMLLPCSSACSTDSTLGMTVAIGASLLR